MPTNAGKPLSPRDIVGLKKVVIPPEVFDAFNELLARKLTNGRATIRQDEVIENVLKRLNPGETPTVSRNDIFERGWLNVEEAYRAEGWNVEYDKPGFNESYKAYFKFSEGD